MSLLLRALIFAALLAGAAGPVGAATLGVAWDPNTEPGVTGYRVYVGTSPGQLTESFDVARGQTSFYYTKAQEGRRYYFAVAALAGGQVGGRSVEVSGVVGNEFTGTPVPQPQPQPKNPWDYWTTYAAGRRALEGSQGESPAVQRLATGLHGVTAIASLPTGGGLLVEAGTRVRFFSEQGVASGTALEADEGTRFISAVADPQFKSTGFVFIAEAHPTPNGGEEVHVVRHRLVGGALGESATIVPGLRQSPDALTPLAITSTGQFLVAQAGQVLRFEPDGSVARNEVMGSPVWAAGVGDSRALAWDQASAGVWSVALDEVSVATVAFASSRDSAASLVRRVPAAVESGVLVDATIAVQAGVARVAVASATTVRRFDVVTSQLSSGVLLADYGTVVSVVPASSEADYVVVREPDANSNTASFALLLVRHDDLP